MGRWKKKSVYTVVKRLRLRLAEQFYEAILKCDDLLILTELESMLTYEKGD